ncbi:YjcQ family protein [Bacillus smithii]|uniref:YjcQ family protein n=1 Tax=Bacillus smithii TaxID=1479 RepID=UPI0030C9C497
MKDDGAIILAILKYLEESMDGERVDHSKINEQSLGISHSRYCRILSMMLEDGLITGLTPVNLPGVTYTQYKFMDPRITLRGIEYLEQNKPSARAYALLKEIRDWIPGM